MKALIILLLHCMFYLHSTTALAIKKQQCRNEITNDSILATYNYKSKFGTESILLTLYKNKTYTFFIYGHISDYFSKGKWEKKDNSFILTSSMQKNEIPITITYSNKSKGLDSSYITVDEIRNKSGLVLRDGEVLTNFDTSISCYPIVGNCKIKRQEIKEIRVKLEGGDQTSIWHIIKLPENKNVINITVEVDFFLHTYKFFKNKEFQIKRNKLFDVERNVYYNKGPLKKSKSVKKNYY